MRMRIERMTSLAGLAVLAVLSAACGDDDTAFTTTPTTTAAADDLVADLRIRYEHPDAGVAFEYGVECGADSSQLTGEAGQAEVEASRACDLLDVPEAADRLVNGPDHGVCTEQYGGPDTAEISGTLFGQEVDTVVDRTNGCGIADWDELLDELLPAAIGVTPPTTG